LHKKKYGFGLTSSYGLTDSSIDVEETAGAIMKQKRGKAPGPDVLYLPYSNVLSGDLLTT